MPGSAGRALRALAARAPRREARAAGTGTLPAGMAECRAPATRRRRKRALPAAAAQSSEAREGRMLGAITNGCRGRRDADREGGSLPATPSAVRSPVGASWNRYGRFGGFWRLKPGQRRAPASRLFHVKQALTARWGTAFPAARESPRGRARNRRRPGGGSDEIAGGCIAVIGPGATPVVSRETPASRRADGRLGLMRGRRML